MCKASTPKNSAPRAGPNGAMFDAARSTGPPTRSRVEMAKLGYPFAHAEPRTVENADARSVDVAFVIDEGQRVYVERIEIHGNLKTRDYVVRREFDFGEGDAYNKTLIDRAERRLKEPELFQDRQDHDQAGLGAGPRRARRRGGRSGKRAISTSRAAIRPPTAGLPRSNWAIAMSTAPAPTCRRP